MSFDPRLLDGFLVCSKSKSPLVRDGESLVCVDPKCRLRYEINEAVPNMLVEEATELSSEAWAEVMQRNGRNPVDGMLPKPAE